MSCHFSLDAFVNAWHELATWQWFLRDTWFPSPTDALLQSPSFHLAETEAEAKCMFHDANETLDANTYDFIPDVLRPFLRSLPLHDEPLGHGRIISSLLSYV